MASARPSMGDKGLSAELEARLDAMDHLDVHDGVLDADDPERAARAAAALKAIEAQTGPCGETFRRARSIQKREATLRSQAPTPASASRPSPEAEKGASDDMLPPHRFGTPRSANSAGVGEQRTEPPSKDQPRQREPRPSDVATTALSDRDGQPEAGQPSVIKAWKFGEMTEDGGVAMSFSDIKSNKLDKLYDAMVEAEAEDRAEDTADTMLLAQKTDAAVSRLGSPTATGRHSHRGSDCDHHDEVVAGLMNHMLPPSKLQGTGGGGGGMPSRRGSKDGRPGPYGSHRPSVDGGPSLLRRQSSDGSEAAAAVSAAAAVAANLNASKQGTPNPISREMASLIKTGIAHTINSELLRTGAAAASGAATADPSRPGTVPGTSASMRSAKDKADKTIRVGFVEGRIKPINIVMLIVGTRGDVQPFIGIGLKLKEYGHRVRIASHAVYREFVTGFGLEFYPIGGDPKVLSEFVVKHRGILPGLNLSDAWEQRQQVKSILYSSFGACVLPDPERPDAPFVADAIVANPPAYGHTHCAEKLNVPLHIIFTMPWTPTKHFPNPFARIKTHLDGNNSKARCVMNWLSYFAVEDLAWIGMADMVKDFRRRTLQLPNWDSKDNGSHTLYHSKVPVSYIWSPSLVPRPDDWPTSCEVVGFINVELQKLIKYEPEPELAEFLAAGPPPVYIGFGSLMLDDPVKLTNAFLTSVRKLKLRAIIQRGWGQLGKNFTVNPPDVFFLDNAPHDWLFERCRAVVHHGGAGTTACGLHAGKPTFIVPFFGDQPFWGAACLARGVGPEPVPIDDLNVPAIVRALKTLVTPACQAAAKRVQAEMLQENGVQGAVDHLHRTIYGALLAGRTFKWMKKGAARRTVITTTLEEGPNGPSGEVTFAGRFKSFFNPGSNPNLAGYVTDDAARSSDSGSLPVAAKGATSPDSVLPDPEGSFRVDIKTGAVLPQPVMRPQPARRPQPKPAVRRVVNRTASGSNDPAARELPKQDPAGPDAGAHDIRRRSAPVVADDGDGAPRRSGFSFLGC